MTFLPIVERELRVAARRSSTYWMRTGVVLVVVLVAGWVFMVSTGSRSSEIGRMLFYVLTAAAALYCLFAGVRSTADCLSEEKREGTLGLLFLTNLRGYDIVLGKLAANSLGTIYGVLAIIPALGLPILLGGTSVGQVIRVSASLVVMLSFSLTAGMLASAICRSSRKAMTSAFLFILLFTAGVPALGSWLAYLYRDGHVVEPFLLTSPVYNFIVGLDEFYLRSGDGYLWSLMTVMVLTVSFLGMAALITPRAWQDRPMLKRDPGSGATAQAADRRAFRSRLLDENPFFWLATRPQSRVIYPWIGYAVIGIIWLWGIGKCGSDWFNLGIYVATAFFLNSMLKVWVASEACRQIAFERRYGTLELLLATPLSVREIVTGQRLALQRQFGLPIAVALALEVLMLAGVLQDTSVSGTDRSMWRWIWFLAMVGFILDLVAFFWMGLWAGLTARDARRAYTRIISAILVLPWVLYLGFLGALAVGVFGPAYEISWKVYVAMWFLSGAAVDVCFALISRERLLNEFRARATERFQARAAQKS